jgi:cytoskeletal protein RodZ
MAENASRQDTLNYKVEPKDSFGASLRRERELRSIPLEDVAKATNIQLTYLQALEEDDYDKLPHSTFVRGFIRSYARYIGLNPDNVIANHEHFMATFPKETEERPIEYQNKKNTWLLATVISCTLFILALLGYYLVVSMQAFKESPPLTTETQPISPSNSGIQPKDHGLIKDTVDGEDNHEIQLAPPSNPGIQPKGSGSIKESVDRTDNSKVQQATPPISLSSPGIQPGDPGSNKDTVDGEDNPEIQPASSPNPGIQLGDPKLLKEPGDSKDSSRDQPANHEIDSEPNDEEGVPLPPTFGPDL